MCRRAYLLIDLLKGIKQEEAERVRRKIDVMDEVDYLDPVNGGHDLIAMIEVPVSTDNTVNSIKQISGVDRVNPCEIFGNHKEW